MQKGKKVKSLFKMDKKHFVSFNSHAEADAENSFWINKSVEDRFDAIEFLRTQWIQLNDLPKKMDRLFFEYR